MKAQYFGDVNDYRKFALLRLMAEVGGFRIGVCWMLTKDDDSGQGAKREHLKRPGDWRGFDPAIFDALKDAPERPTLADLQRVEKEGLIPGATYFEALVPEKKDERAVWHSRCFGELAGVELAFFDPDNGLEITARSRGRKNSNKYAFLEELAAHYEAGCSVLVYQHYPRHKPRVEVIANAHHRLATAMPGAKTLAFTTPFVAFLLAVRPEHAARVSECLAEVERRGWRPRLFGPA